MYERIQKVVIRNFKCFGDEIVFDLPGHVVLVGPNNCGKTTFLQAVAAWAFAYGYWLQRTPDTNPRRAFKKVPIARQAFASVPLRTFELLWTDRATDQPIQIEVLADVFGLFPLGMEIGWDTSEQAYVRPMWVSDQVLLRMAGVPEVVYVPPMTGLSVEEPVYQPPKIAQLLAQGRPGEVIRNLLLGASKDPATWLDLGATIQRLFGYELLPPDDTGPAIVAEYRKKVDGPRFDIASAGSGFQQVLMLMTFLTTRQGAVLLVDEPDAHLHVILQNSIYQELKRLASQRRSQLVLATHSEVIVNAVDPAEIMVLMGKQPHVLLDKAQRQQLTQALRGLSNTDIMLASQAPGILYLEGHTDLAILKEWARILDHPVRKLFDSPQFFWRPTVWEVADGVAGIRSREHFQALQLAAPTLRALEILDGDSKGQQQATPLTGSGYQKLKWLRYEIESYLFHPAVLERFVRGRGGDAAAHALRQHLADNMPPRFLVDPLADLPMLANIKARTDLLPPALNAAGISDMGYTDYFEIAAVMQPEEIHPEVKAKLDGILIAFGLAPSMQTPGP